MHTNALERVDASDDDRDRRARHELAGAIFDQVRELAEHQRRVLIDSRCGDDVALRTEVEALLAEHDRATGFLVRPALQSLPTAAGAHAELPPPDKIGSYRILSLLGHGGMGAVYLAEQENPARQVALKLLLPGVSTPERVARLAREAHVLGRLQHPCIAQIFEAGLADAGAGSQPYFAMELVHGEPLTAAAERRGLGLHERAQLLARICRAVHYAHEHGVIHRDLKPANILLDESGSPKVLDFGVARTTDVERAHATATGEVVGTLGYMSPEQLSESAATLDARSDVYALGVIAYELLSGRAPLDLEGLPLPAAAALIREREPQPLGAIDPRLRGDLSTIVSKALAKERDRRYASALELAEDLDRYLHDEPIRARPPSTVYQVAKFARRNRVLVLGMATTVVALIVGLAAALFQRDRAVRAAERAEHEAIRASAEATNAKLAEGRAQRAVERSDAVKDFVGGILNQVSPDLRGPGARMSDVLRAATLEIDSGFSDAPDIRAELQWILGQALHELALYDEALPLLRESVATRRALFGPDDPQTLQSQGTLFNTLVALARWDEAEPLGRETRAASERVCGAENTETLRVLGDLGVLLRDQGRFEEAHELMSRVVEVESRTRTPVQQVAAKRNLARVATLMGRFDEAQALFSEILPLLDDPATARTIDLATKQELAEFLRTQHLLAQAEALSRETWIQRVALLGHDHESSITSELTLALTLTEAGKLDEADELYRELEPLQARIWKPEHPNALRFINNLAMLREEQGRLDEALALDRALVETRTRLLGRDSFETLFAINNLGVVLFKLGNYAESECLLLEVAIARDRKCGTSHPDTLMSWTSLAWALLRQQRTRDARDVLNTTLQHASARYGDDYPGSATLHALLGMSLQADGNEVGALEEFDRSVTVATATLPAGDAERAAYELARAQCCMRLHKFADAIETLERVAGDLEGAGFAGELQDRVLATLREARTAQGDASAAQVPAEIVH